jgi:hypothetical protein
MEANHTKQLRAVTTEYGASPNRTNTDSTKLYRNVKPSSQYDLNAPQPADDSTPASQEKIIQTFLQIAKAALVKALKPAAECFPIPNFKRPSKKPFVPYREPPAVEGKKPRSGPRHFLPHVIYPPHILARRFPAQSVPNTVETVPKLPVRRETLSPSPVTPVAAVKIQSPRPLPTTTYYDPTPVKTAPAPDGYLFWSHWHKPLPKPPVPNKPSVPHKPTKTIPLYVTPAAPKPVAPKPLPEADDSPKPRHVPHWKVRQNAAMLDWNYALASRPRSTPAVKSSTFVPPKDFVPNPSAKALQDAADHARANSRWRKKVSSRRTPGF